MHKNQYRRSFWTKNKNILSYHCKYDIKEDGNDFIECDNCGKSFLVFSTE